MHSIYEIENTEYLEPEEEYFDPSIYPNFQEDYLKFKELLIKESESKINNTYY